MHSDQPCAVQAPAHVNHRVVLAGVTDRPDRSERHRPRVVNHNVPVVRAQGEGIMIGGDLSGVDAVTLGGDRQGV